ncbi:hypothetical protein MMC18_009445 [Xylographa bjoerkii]|nr:hypothetical protein [Xylographa bjoerkii]
MSEKKYLIEIRPTGLRLALHVEHLRYRREDQIAYYNYCMGRLEAARIVKKDRSMEELVNAMHNVNLPSHVLVSKICAYLKEKHGLAERLQVEVMNGVLRGLWSEAVSADLDTEDFWRTENMWDLFESDVGRIMFRGASVPLELMKPTFCSSPEFELKDGDKFHHLVFSWRHDDTIFKVGCLDAGEFPEFDITGFEDSSIDKSDKGSEGSDPMSLSSG